MKAVPRRSISSSSSEPPSMRRSAWRSINSRSKSTTASTSCTRPRSTRSGSALSRPDSADGISAAGSPSSSIERTREAVRRPRARQRQLHAPRPLLERDGKLPVDEVGRVLRAHARVRRELSERGQRAARVELRVHVIAAARRHGDGVHPNAELHAPAHVRELIPQLLAVLHEQRPYVGLVAEDRSEPHREHRSSLHQRVHDAVVVEQLVRLGDRRARDVALHERREEAGMLAYRVHVDHCPATFSTDATSARRLTCTRSMSATASVMSPEMTTPPPSSRSTRSTSVTSRPRTSVSLTAATPRSGTAATAP